VTDRYTAAVHQWLNPAGSYPAIACLWWLAASIFWWCYWTNFFRNKYSSSLFKNRFCYYSRIFEYSDIHSQP